MHKVWTAELQAEIVSAAAAAGFHLAGIAAAEPEPPPAEGNRFAAWIDAGRAGEMDYLKRRDDTGKFLRSGLRVALPWARSIIVCALDYSSEDPLSIEPAPPGTGWIGRYAWSGRRGEERDKHCLLPTDYHKELLARLKTVEATLLMSTACETRCYVDTGPIVERDFAAVAGVGWIGKNTCVLNQDRGSWLLLGVIVTSLPVAASQVQLTAPDRCGSCTRCIDACPTSALVAPREMDASRCIAYLTIEKKGTIAADLRAPMGRQVFGCDICQDVCPWNQKRRSTPGRGGTGNHAAANAVPSGMEQRTELINPSLEWLGSMDAEDFKRLFKSSPLERTGRKRLLRNVAIAMGNTGELYFLPRLGEWAEGEDRVLAEAAAWAINQINSAHNTEPDAT